MPKMGAPRIQTLAIVLAVLLPVALSAETPLETAICDNDLSRVQELVRAGANVNEKQGDGDNYPLLIACYCYGGRPEIARYLLSVGAKVNLHPRNSYSALMWAIQSYESVSPNDPMRQVAFLMLERGADANYVDPATERTPLMGAAEQGDRQLVELLLSKGADPGPKASGDWCEPGNPGMLCSAADLARKRGHVELAQYLEKKAPSPSPTASTNIVTLTEANWKEQSRVKPIIAVAYFACGTTSSVFKYALHDLKGVNVATIDVDGGNILNHDLFGWDVLYLIWKGKVVKAAIADQEVRTSFVRNWARKTLRENGIPYELGPDEPFIAEPISVPGDLRLSDELAGTFNFDNGPKNSAPGATQQFLVSNGESAFSISGGTLNSTGEDIRDDSGAGFGIVRDEPKDGLTIHLNFNLQQREAGLGDGFLLAAWGDYIKVSVLNHRLHVSLRADKSLPQGQNSTYFDGDYVSDDVVTFNTWHDLVARVDPKTKRVSLTLDGKRQKDVVLSGLFQKLYTKNENSNMAVFDFGPCGWIMKGSIDNLFIYERALNDNEMKALYEQHRKLMPVMAMRTLSVGLSDKHQKFLAAAYAGNSSKMGKLDADRIDSAYNGWTALLYSAYFGRTALVQALLKAGANPFATVGGWDAARIARKRGFPETARAIEAGMLASPLAKQPGFAFPARTATMPAVAVPPGG
ncbi:MAG: ankyrin repeat domain-containing protein [Leptospirales bacterium]|nr:ankyrin repeat domain-containing protein [Leptospirales bacterium]